MQAGWKMLKPLRDMDTDHVSIQRMKMERNKAVPASYLILEKEGKVLLSRRYNTGYQDGDYSLPAGHVDAGELPTDTMVREAKEEVSISVNPKDLTLVHVIYREATNKTGDRIDFFYKTFHWTGEIKNLEPNKCDELTWFPLNDLPTNMAREVSHMFKALAQGIFFSELRSKQS